MKSGKLFVLSAVLLVLGLVVSLVGFALLDFDVTNFDTEPPYIKREMTVSSDLKKIVLDEYKANINIEKSEDAKIHISYYENLNNTYNIVETDGVLTMVKQRTAENFADEFLTLSVSTPTVTVALPEKFSGEMHIDLTDGNINAKSATLSCLAADTQNGDVFINSCTFSGHLDLRSERGGIRIYETKVATNCKLKCKSGELFLWSLDAKDVYANTRGGLITLAHVKADTIYAEGTSKDIITSCIAFETDAHLITAGGDIRGSVVGTEGDFTYHCSAPEGNCNLDDSTSHGAKNLHAKTEQGKINITLMLPEAQVSENAD